MARQVTYHDYLRLDTILGTQRPPDYDSDDPEATRNALILARDRLARRADADPALDRCLVTLVRLLDEAIAAELPIWVERI